MELADAYVENAEVLGYTPEDMQTVYDTVVAQITAALHFAAFIRNPTFLLVVFHVK